MILRMLILGSLFLSACLPREVKEFWREYEVANKCDPKGKCNVGKEPK